MADDGNINADGGNAVDVVDGEYPNYTDDEGEMGDPHILILKGTIAIANGESSQVKSV